MYNAMSCLSYMTVQDTIAAAFGRYNNTSYLEYCCFCNRREILIVYMCIDVGGELECRGHYANV